jgi:hypothetical protein
VTWQHREPAGSPAAVSRTRWGLACFAAWRHTEGELTMTGSSAAGRVAGQMARWLVGRSGRLLSPRGATPQALSGFASRAVRNQARTIPHCDPARLLVGLGGLGAAHRSSGDTFGCTASARVGDGPPRAPLTSASHHHATRPAYAAAASQRGGASRPPCGCHGSGQPGSASRDNGSSSGRRGER